MLYDGELDHQHQNLENEVTNTRRDLAGTRARLVEVDNELGAFRTEVRAELAKLRGDAATARQALVELDDFHKHVAANLASLNELAAELTAEVAALAGKDEDGSFVAMTVGVLRALTWTLGFQFRGEPVPGDWDPDAEYARLARETEADKPKLRKLEECWGGPDEPETEADKPAPARNQPFDIADQAIGLFLEYRDQHDHDEESARRAAALEVAEGASVTDAEIGLDRPAPVKPAKTPAECDGSSDCPGVVMWHWRPPGHPDQIVELCDEHAKDKDLSDLVDLRSIEVPW